MKNNTQHFFILFVLLFTIVGFSQNKKGNLRCIKDSKHILYVVFESDLNLGDLALINKNLETKIPELAPILKEYPFVLEKGIRLSEKKMKHLERSSEIAAKNSHAKKQTKLNHIFKVKIANPTNERLLQLATLLESLPSVSYCYLSSLKPIAPPGDIAPATPDFFSSQTYVGENPGVNMQYAWDLGYTGKGINIRDIEFAMNFNHEDLIDDKIKIASNMAISKDKDSIPESYYTHGTAVAGVIYGLDNGYGITGLAHGADSYTFYPEYTDEIPNNRINAITRAIEDSKEGDVIMYEMQDYGVVITDIVAAEYNPIVWDLTKAASEAGIIIVQAAGNKSVDYDSADYKSYIDRGDSGAIMVGGGTPDSNHDKVSYSNYGSRIDLQGWAEKVATTGDFVRRLTKCSPILINNDINQAYTTCFAGTSSATPMVASCAVVLQSYYFAQTGNYLNSLQIRDILKTTGIPQGAGGNIGEFPDMKAAMQKIDDNYLLSTPSETFDASFIVYPNPVTDNFNVVIPAYFSANTNLSVYNSVGQLVLNQALVNGLNTTNTNQLTTGVYVIKVTDGNYTAIKRIVKK